MDNITALLAMEIILRVEILNGDAVKIYTNFCFPKQDLFSEVNLLAHEKLELPSRAEVGAIQNLLCDAWAGHVEKIFTHLSTYLL